MKRSFLIFILCMISTAAWAEGLKPRTPAQGLKVDPNLAFVPDGAGVQGLPAQTAPYDVLGKSGQELILNWDFILQRYPDFKKLPVEDQRSLAEQVAAQIKNGRLSDSAFKTNKGEFINSVTLKTSESGDATLTARPTKGGAKIQYKLKFNGVGEK